MWYDSLKIDEQAREIAKLKLQPTNIGHRGISIEYQLSWKYKYLDGPIIALIGIIIMTAVSGAIIAQIKSALPSEKDWN